MVCYVLPSVFFCVRYSLLGHGDIISQYPHGKPSKFYPFFGGIMNQEYEYLTVILVVCSLFAMLILFLFYLLNQ